MYSAREIRDLATRLEKLHLSRGCLSMAGHTLSYYDSKRMYYAYILWCILAKECSVQMIVAIKKSKGQPESIIDGACQQIERTWRQVSIFKLVREDVQEQMDMFKAALLALRHIPTEGDITGLSAANTAAKRLYKQYGGVQAKGPAWGLVKAFLAATILFQDSRMFQLTNILVQYLVRITLQDVDWIIQDAIDDYKSFEEQLKSQEYSPDVVSEVKCIIDDWFKDFDTEVDTFVDELQAEHGYGATAEVHRSEGTAAKYRNVHMTLEAYYLSKELKWLPSQYVWPGLAKEAWHSRYLRKHHLTPSSSSEFTGEVQFVPKGTNKKRVVSKEPTTNIFFQKKINVLMDKYFRKHPEMHINLHRQENNREMALDGSTYGNFATIDLSSASDSVTLTLVRNLFADQPRLLRLLMWSRTKQVRLPDGCTVELEKFAPMGGGTCFPVECVVFSAVVAAVMKRHGKHSRYWVYGDDIVVPKWAYDEVIDLLHQLNFIPNDDKSYGHGSLFTESCGIECFRGFDVSPIRISRKWDPIDREIGIINTYYWAKRERLLLRFAYKYYLYFLSKNQEVARLFLKRFKEEWQVTQVRASKDRNVGISQIETYYELANNATDEGFYILAAAYQKLTSSVYDEVVWSNNHTYGFYTLENIPAKLWNRLNWDSDSQSYYVRCDALRVTTDPGEDILRYSKMLEALSTTRRTSLIHPEDRIEAACGAARTVLRSVRVPYRDLISRDSELTIH